MVGGGAEPSGGVVIRVSPGQDPKDAPMLGPLPLVIIDWLEGKLR